ncbi:MAG: MarR family transcriptional regulator [Coriobacteriales bacterium]|nr:MarR family transcriptional regulator [Coriobacteriales bacterium]
MKNGERLGRLFRLVSHQFEEEKRGQVAELGVTGSQLDVLDFLELRGGAATQAEIGDYLRASRPTVSGLVTRLERRGLVTRDTSAHDGRAVVVRIADEAQPIVQAFREKGEEMDYLLTAGLTDNERDELVRLLRKMVGPDEG